MIIGNVRVSESGSSRHLRAGRPLCFGMALLSLVISCGLAPAARTPGSVGHSTDGWLRAGVAMPDQGPGYVRARHDDDTRWSVPRLRSLLQRAAAEVARAWPG